jgi:hypothetical protein
MGKKTYEPPELIVHGTVAEITLGEGSGNLDVPCGAIAGLDGGNPGMQAEPDCSAFS